MEPTPWRCPNGHTMGMVVRRENIKQLAVFRHALRPDLPEQRGDILLYLVGPADNITCSICFERRSWIIGGGAMERWLARETGGGHGNH